MSASVAQGRPKRILVIDEDAVGRAKSQTALSEAGYEADGAIDQMHAAELATIRDYGLVLASRPLTTADARLASIPTLVREADLDILRAVGERLGAPKRRDTPLIDHELLERLRADTTPDLFRKLLGEFLECSRARLARIETLLDQSDLPALAHEAHALKGTAATFGIPRLRDLAGALDMAAKARDIAAVRAVLPDLRRVAEASWTCLLEIPL